MNEVKVADGLIVIPESHSIIELFTGDGMTDILGKIKDEVAGHKPDLTTIKGRKAIASLSAKVSKSKILLDNLGKGLVADQKKQIAIVDQSRREMRDELNLLRDQARKPLSEWEDEQRQIAFEEHEKIEREYAHAEAMQDNELFDLRREKFEREEAERVAKNLRDESERKAEEKRQRVANEERIRREVAEATMLESKKAIAMEKERAAESERKRIAAEERAKIEKEQAVEIERDKAKAEAERIQRENIAIEKEKEKLERERLAAEEKKSANKQHQAILNREAMQDIANIFSLYPEDMDIVKSNYLAKTIIIAIAKGEISNVTINY